MWRLSEKSGGSGTNRESHTNGGYRSLFNDSLSGPIPVMLPRGFCGDIWTDKGKMIAVPSGEGKEEIF